VKPEVLRGSRLGFAQLLTIYDGLYDPDEDEPRIFREFNRLRNKIAHTREDPEATIMATLRNVRPDVPAGAGDLLVQYFLFMFFGRPLGI